MSMKKPVVTVTHDDKKKETIDARKSVGCLFLDPDDEVVYILVALYPTIDTKELSYILVNLKTGNRWTDPVPASSIQRDLNEGVFVPFIGTVTLSTV